jgi:peroxiredoxin
MNQLRVAQGEYDEIRRQGGEIVAFVGATQDEVKAATEQHGLEFPVLADTDFAAADHFGMRHSDALPDRDAMRPGIFFVRGDGTVAGSIQEETYRHVATGEQIRAGFARAVTSP